MRVVVAMSGGVDSSTVAALLHEAGHDVIGVTLQLYDHGAATGRRGACCAGQDIHDAKRVADHLGIPHYVVDAEARFHTKVVRDFADTYARGETPVPCVQCNRDVKFPQLIELAAALGAERLATGHYVRRLDGTGGAELHVAADGERDQSWFLFATTPAQLEFLWFPLGAMPDKDAVRVQAERLGLTVARKADSQDICFVPTGHYADVVARLRPDAMQPGEIVDVEGRIVGRHAGIARYTVGQGKRLGSASVENGERQAVVALDAARRRVVVGPRSPKFTTVALRDVNWIARRPAGSIQCRVKLRARDIPQPATVDGERVVLAAPSIAAAGQACVFYDGTRVLGGGFIARAYG